MPRAHTSRTVIPLAVILSGQIAIGCSMPTPSRPIVIPTIKSPAKVISAEEREARAAYMRAYNERQRLKRITLAENTGPAYSEEADAERRSRRNQEKRQAEEQAKRAAREGAEAKLSLEPEELCADLHPDAHYMTPPDEDGTVYWVPKEVADFANFASCFNQRYGGAFAPQDFRPCNSIPGLSEADRLDCVFNEERPSPRQWCNDKFDYGRKGAPASWRHCTNELYVLNGLPRTEPKQPKTAGEMRQDEREFMETASAYARRHYRACILQFAKPSNVARQSCRDLARGSEELSKKLT